MENIEVLQQEVVGARSRRSALLMGGAALAGLALARGAQAQAAAVTDADILNFALNLEFLEAQYYTLATTGLTIDKLPAGAASGSTAPIANGPVPITGGGGQAGGTVTVKASPLVPFVAGSPVMAYALETAQEERNHVAFLQSALNASGANAAIAMPNIDLLNSFNALATAAGLTGGFDPFASEENFLLGSYIFEDVGVTAYLGAAPLISATANLSAALAIHAVEAYHAGIVRTQIFRLGSAAQAISTAISNVRQTLAGAGSPVDTGVSTVQNAAIGQTASTVVDVDPSTAIIVGRTTSQVLSIVYGGGAIGTGGAFFPQGTNGTIR